MLVHFSKTKYVTSMLSPGGQSNHKVSTSLICCFFIGLHLCLKHLPSNDTPASWPCFENHFSIKWQIVWYNFYILISKGNKLTVRTS